MIVKHVNKLHAPIQDDKLLDRFIHRPHFKSETRKDYQKRYAEYDQAMRRLLEQQETQDLEIFNKWEKDQAKRRLCKEVYSKGRYIDLF
jgi:predicted subunit of tRNA(5-methylaminomethyl-2-thiouridylate) methyltransferase